MSKIIELKNVSRQYKMGNDYNRVLSDVNLDIIKGEIIVILGPSGSGKTTLLNVMSGLDSVTSGEIFWGDTDISKLSDFKMIKFRRDNVGFIFQTYNLLKNLNVYENILVGSKLGKNKLDIDDKIKMVGLLEHRNKHIYELSGGEEQRVSIARVLSKNPEVIFCDEPTGNLDEMNGRNVLEALVEVNEKYGTTIIIVTHNPSIAFIGDRVIKMNSSRIVGICENKVRVKPQDITWG